jgi:hypothetical protein
MSLIIYLQPWSESMASPFHFMDFSSFPQDLGF